jgi:hypothetical protein
MFLAAVLSAQPAQESGSRAGLQDLAEKIEMELQSHGERALGNESLHWSTHLAKLEDCRAEFSVRLTNNVGEPTVRAESVNFSLGALDPYGIAPKKNWLELPCEGVEKCVFSTSTCSRTTKEGITIDCATASQRRVGSFLLQLDGDAAATSRLEEVFREAISLCRERQVVAF